MSQGIPEMIEIATEKRWKEDFQGKHKKRAGKGWFRYNTRFALPVVNEKRDTHLGQDRQMVRNPFPFINYNITFY